MNLPNKITMFRVVLIPFFVFFMLSEHIAYHNYIAVAIFIVASLTDMLDGKIARKYNLVSNFGKFMDPLADKLLVSSAMICFVAIPSNPMPAWVVIVIIASYWGKIKTVTQMVMSILLIVNFDGYIINIVEYVFIYAALILTVISLVDYMVKNWSVMRDGNM